jgi:hypothetical protein
MFKAADVLYLDPDFPESLTGEKMCPAVRRHIARKAEEYTPEGSLVLMLRVVPRLDILKLFADID